MLQSTSPEWWPFVAQMAALTLSLIGGGATVPVIRWLKDSLNLSGRWVYILIWAISLLLALAAVVVEGALTPGAINWESAGLIVTAVILGSQIEYRRIKDSGGFG